MFTVAEDLKQSDQTPEQQEQSEKKEEKPQTEAYWPWPPLL
jgi:hypothetical protein